MLVPSIVIFICCLTGFVFASMRYYGSSKSLYIKLVIFALGSAMLGRLFDVITLLTRGDIGATFNVGMLGIAGCFLFSLSANYGQMDSLVDDKSRANHKYRVMALIAPLLILSGYIIIALSDVSVGSKIAYFLVFIPIALSSYYHLKHLIIKDVDLGIVKSIRGFNICGLLLAVLNMAEITLFVKGAQLPLIVVYGLISVLYLIMVPILVTGMKKWTL